MLWPETAVISLCTFHSYLSGDMCATSQISQKWSNALKWVLIWVHKSKTVSAQVSVRNVKNKRNIIKTVRLCKNIIQIYLLWFYHPEFSKCPVYEVMKSLLALYYSLQVKVMCMKMRNSLFGLLDEDVSGWVLLYIGEVKGHQMGGQHFVTFAWRDSGIHWQYADNRSRRRICICFRFYSLGLRHFHSYGKYTRENVQYNKNTSFFIWANPYRTYICRFLSTPPLKMFCCLLFQTQELREELQFEAAI